MGWRRIFKRIGELFKRNGSDWDFLVGDIESSFKKFRELIYKLYRVYPTGGVAKEEIKRVVVIEDVIESLVQSKVLRREICDDGREYYFLDVNGIGLVSNWEIERLNKYMTILTFYIYILTFIQVLIVLLSIFK